jgi:hypothetical protein
LFAGMKKYSTIISCFLYLFTTKFFCR